MKKFLRSDWLIAVQFLVNKVQKKEIKCKFLKIPKKLLHFLSFSSVDILFTILKTFTEDKYSKGSKKKREIRQK